jgi:prepilin-type N-terminal cleavage/methylation domain-containing protein
MKKNGFTFIELLVVITIMAVVFAAGVVSYTSIAINSRDTRRRADLEAIRQALEMCRSIAGIYPSSIYPTDPGSIICSDTNKSVTMKTTPIDPKPCSTQADGHYTYTLTDGGYTLTANCLEGTTKSVTVTNP